ncbi:iron-containing alcohol dehydrogenase (plasmid) [Agrobacterium leguminum]|uniref:Alcohol dehydrogenase, class IV n=1 Tax=Agrobacterium deltaense NCPPB 1641 TaxID=1183425 RepID=A0A1S7U934_9HYPH|nr:MULTISPECIES: iron-containing alcohol dehydrogenase [Agrobacterium]WFS70077.1 iron-containing alcohol dehydrogenase [Agrobacterium leguminum]CVI63444.1 Alcohol dehydrogenase, class IV [Agrobacterium deltaense NCPPB 1641]
MTLFGAVRLPRNIVFGTGQRNALPQYASRAGQRALIVTDERFAADATFRDLVDAVARAGVTAKVFAGVIAELPVECIAVGVDAGKAFGADFVIGIGGGSCLDAAKVISLLLAHGGKASDYYGEFQVPGPILPLISIPTTSGTGSEVTPVAVLTDPDRTLKIGIASPYLISETAICDPELTYTCPPSLTAVSGADALTHAIEAFTTARGEPSTNLVHEHVFLGKNSFSDHYALLAIRHIGASLRPAVENGSDIIARERLMYGAMAAGLAFGTAGTAAAHAVQYPVGAMTHTPHGTGVALMMPYVMQINRDWCAPEIVEIGQALGLSLPQGQIEAAADATIDAIADLFSAIGIPATLKDLGIKREQLADVAEQSLGIARLIKNNPRPLHAVAMEMLVGAAFNGDRASLKAHSDQRKAG